MSPVSLFDARSFFEKTLVFGVQHGIIPPEKIEAMNADAPKGIVQIARYLGNEFRRSDLQKAKDRMVNLVSLYLEHSTGADLQKAAESLRDHSFLSRSKGGSDMLKALIAMPQDSHFGMIELGSFTDKHIPQLAEWALRPLTDYQLELDKRAKVALVLEAAIWMANELGLDASDLEEEGKDAEAVIRTALLLSTLKRIEMPDWVVFEKMILTLRKNFAPVKTSAKAKAPSKTPAKATAQATAPDIQLPKQLPERFKPVVEAMRQSVVSDLSKILDPSITARRLFDQTPAFMGRYFWIENMVHEVDHFDRAASAAWQKVSGGHQDPGSLLTLFLCVAAGAAPKTLLTGKGAAALVRKIKKTGIQPELASQYIAEHAPKEHQGDYESLWADFIEEALPTLQSDQVTAHNDALALLRRDCHVAD